MGKKKIKICSASNGTGRYDNNNSPFCASCCGLGIERSRMPYRLWKSVAIKYYGKTLQEIERAKIKQLAN